MNPTHKKTTIKRMPITDVTEAFLIKLQYVDIEEARDIYERLQDGNTQHKDDARTPPGEEKRDD